MESTNIENIKMENTNIENTTVKILTPSEFIALYEKNPESIKSSFIVPPELGKPGFGKIITHLDSPVDLCEEYLNSRNGNFKKEP